MRWFSSVISSRLPSASRRSLRVPSQACASGSESVTLLPERSSVPSTVAAFATLASRIDRSVKRRNSAEASSSSA